MLQSGKASLGENLLRVLTTEPSSEEEMFKSLDLTSDHGALETINRLEAAIFSWKERTMEPVSGKSSIRTSWSYIKDSASDMDNMELLLDRVKSQLHLLKKL